MFRRLCVWILVLTPTVTFAASKEIQELQRDVAQLQDQIRQLQQSQDRQLTVLSTQVLQAVDAAQKANTAMAVFQSNFDRNLQQMQDKVVAPVVGFSTRIDGMTNDLHTLQQAVSDLNALITKMQAQITDLGNAMKIIQVPAAAPPSGQGAGSASMASPGGSGEAPPISASDLYNNAIRDRTSGKLDLALQQFADYLKWYGNTDLAPNAQFYIGMIHYSQGDFQNSASDFDLVLEKYSKNTKTADARYYKGMSLLRLPGHKTQAGEEFKDLIKEYPGTDRAKDACTQLTGLGLRCTAAAASAPKRSKRR